MSKTYFETHTQQVPQYRATRRNGVSPSGTAVIHTSEPGTSDFAGPDNTAENTARYFCTNPRQASYHYIADYDSAIHLTPWAGEAWHDTASNNWSTGFAAANRAADWKTLGERGNETVRRLAAGAALWAKWMKATHGVTVPAKRITRAEAMQRKPGFLGHGEMDPARRTDPGKAFNWSLFLSEFSRLMGYSGSTPAPKPPTPPAKPATTHKIVQGERLSGLARRYKTTVAALTQLNGIKDPNKIYAGQVLKLPLASTPAPKPAPTPKPSTALPIKLGAKNAVVGKVQYELRKQYPLYAENLARDDSFGPATAKAVREFHRRKGRTSSDITAQMIKELGIKL